MYYNITKYKYTNMYFSISHKINLTLLIVSISVSVLIEYLLKDKKLTNSTLNIVSMSVIIYALLYCVAKYTNIYETLEMYEGFESEDKKSDDDSEDKKETTDKKDDTETTTESTTTTTTETTEKFESAKRPTTENHQIDPSIKAEADSNMQNLRDAVADDRTDSKLLRQIKGELDIIRTQMVEDQKVRQKMYEYKKENSMIKAQQKIVSTKTPLKYENGWSMLSQPGQWQFPAIFPPQCLNNGQEPKDNAKPTYTTLNKPFSEYLSSDKFSQAY